MVKQGRFPDATRWAERAGAALDRIDTIYADRLDGFRARTMSGGLR